MEIDGDVQGGDIKASESSSVNSLKKAINAFFNNVSIDSYKRYLGFLTQKVKIKGYLKKLPLSV